MECGAKKRDGTPCRAPAMENGRCRIHGGKSLKGVESPTFKHGRYSKHLPQAIRDKLLTADDDPLDLLPELDVQRALFADYLSRFEAGMRLSAGDINMLMQWATDIGKQVERITKQRNETALTSAEIAFLAARVADVISRHIHDPEQQQAFLADIFAALPAGNSIETSSDGEPFD